MTGGSSRLTLRALADGVERLLGHKATRVKLFRLARTAHRRHRDANGPQLIDDAIGGPEGETISAALLLAVHRFYHKDDADLAREYPRTADMVNPDAISAMVLETRVSELSKQQLARLWNHLDQFLLGLPGAGNTSTSKSHLDDVPEPKVEPEPEAKLQGPVSDDQRPPSEYRVDSVAKTESVKAKRSTSRGEAEEKLIGALTLHHKYADGGCLNTEPVGNNQLARIAGVSQGSASRFFQKKFGGHEKYKAKCGDVSKLVKSLKILNNDFSPDDLYGNVPPSDRDRHDIAD